MSTTLTRDLDSFADWRRALERRLEQFGGLLADFEVLDAEGSAMLHALHQQLASDRLVVAFVAEFSRGKSELINALFFADVGCRVLPATPGRTTMCPVELGWDAAGPPSLALLPISTRREGTTVSQLRSHRERWHRIALPQGDPAGLAQAMREVTRTQRVGVDEARALGLWDDEQSDDNPPVGEDGLVEVPAWRHALINYPHPLLRRGLVVIDTPGLNAIGAEPELTLGLLPSAHAIVFVLGADTGVTRSDLAIWRGHLGERAMERFVVLNKIDTLEDPLLDDAQVAAQVRAQVESVSATLGVPDSRVFPLSARRALAARLAGDQPELLGSGLPALEQAIGSQLLPQRGAVVAHLIEDTTLRLQQVVVRQLADRRRQMAEQLAELAALRGKSATKLQMMARRLDRDAAAFEECLPRLTAMRAVLGRMLAQVAHQLSSERLRTEVGRMRSDSEASVLRLGAGRAFAQLGRRLHALFDEAETGVTEIDQMLAGSHRQLNAEFGFALSTGPKPALAAYRRELERIESAYGTYFGITKVWRLSDRAFLGQFIQVLLSRLRVVFENAAVEVELWAKTATTQMESQLRERRRSVNARREALGRIQVAEGELEHRIREVEEQIDHLRQVEARVRDMVDSLRVLAASGTRQPPAEATVEPAPRLELVHSVHIATVRDVA